MIKITGFMMHGFKDRSQPGALILTDEKSQDRPEGGTGKGIYMAALRKFKRSAVFDGKAFNFDKSFLWQRVSQDTQIIYIEDVKRGFDFERLFSALTEGIEIERKNKDSFYLPYELSPKIAISTNYTLKGDGNSNQRRRIEVEFKDFFNVATTSTVTVTISNAATTDTSVLISSADPAIVAAPVSVTIPANSHSANFTVAGLVAGTTQLTATFGAGAATKVNQLNLVTLVVVLAWHTLQVNDVDDAHACFCDYLRLALKQEVETFIYE